MPPWHSAACHFLGWNKRWNKEVGLFNRFMVYLKQPRKKKTSLSHFLADTPAHGLERGAAISKDPNDHRLGWQMSQRLIAIAATFKAKGNDLSSTALRAHG